MVARGGIEPPTRGFSDPKVDTLANARLANLVCCVHVLPRQVAYSVRTCSQFGHQSRHLPRSTVRLGAINWLAVAGEARNISNGAPSMFLDKFGSFGVARMSQKRLKRLSLQAIELLKPTVPSVRGLMSL